MKFNNVLFTLTFLLFCLYTDVKQVRSKNKCVDICNVNDSRMSLYVFFLTTYYCS